MGINSVIRRATIRRDGHHVEMLPEGAEILFLEVDGPHPAMWYRCDPDAAHVRRVFMVVGSNQAFACTYIYRGSFLDRGTAYHLLEIPSI